MQEKGRLEFEREIATVIVKTQKKLKKLQSSINVYEFKSFGQKVQEKKLQETSGDEKAKISVKKPSSMMLQQFASAPNSKRTKIRRTMTSANMMNFGFQKTPKDSSKKVHLNLKTLSKSASKESETVSRSGSAENIANNV